MEGIETHRDSQNIRFIVYSNINSIYSLFHWVWFCLFSTAQRVVEIHCEKVPVLHIKQALQSHCQQHHSSSSHNSETHKILHTPYLTKKILHTPYLTGKILHTPYLTGEILHTPYLTEKILHIHISQRRYSTSISHR